VSIRSESDIESKVIQYAESKGVLQVKLNLIGRSGWPDRMLLYKGSVAFIEFKKAGEKPRELQKHIHEQLRRHGFNVYVVDQVSDGLLIVEGIAKGGADV
jgi:hypothetical protein